MVLPADSPLSLVRTTAHLTFRGTHGGAEGNQHSAVPLASTRQGAGVRLAIQEGTDVSGLALGSGSSSKASSESTPGQGPPMETAAQSPGPHGGLAQEPRSLPWG